jgi:CheY-like chemotaxis protein
MVANSNIPSLLIVDDIPANLVALRRILRDLNIKIIEAASGNEALALMLEHDFALILLDVQMPMMSGYEVAEIMQDNDETSHIPIIFVTANETSESNLLKGYKAGAIDYIIKPINKTVLRSKVQVIIELARHKSDNPPNIGLYNSMLPSLISSTSAPFKNINNALSELQGSKLKDTQIEQLKIIDHQQYSLQNIIHCVNDLSSFSSTQKDDAKQSFDLTSVLENTFDKIQPQATTLNKIFSLSGTFSNAINILGNAAGTEKILYYAALCFVNSSPEKAIDMTCSIIDDGAQHMLVKFELSDTLKSTPDDLYKYFIRSADHLEPDDEKNIMLSITSDLLETVGGLIGRSIDGKEKPCLWITIPYSKPVGMTIDSIQRI